jgi:hypothetical protein
MFVRLSVSAEFVEQESKVIEVSAAIPFVSRLFAVIGCGRVFDDGPVVVVGLSFGGGEPSED